MKNASPDERLTMKQAARELGVSLPTCWRYVLKGVRGVVLQSFCVGGRRFTNSESVAQFIENTTAAAAGSAPSAGRTKRTAAAAQAQAHRETEVAGI